jgi:hypothetical protein
MALRSLPPRVVKPKSLSLPAVQPAGQGMAYSIEMRILANGNELGADDVQIALDEGALKSLLGQYNTIGIDFYKVAVIYPDHKEEHEQVRGRLTKKSRRLIMEEVGRQPLTIAILGEHDGETCCLYVRSNHPRKGGK